MLKFFKQISYKHSRTRAFSTFESILLIPAISVLILGALDVSRVLQAYSALDEGVTESLRCVFPTDGECAYSVNSNLTPRYNYYKTTTNTQFLRKRNRFTADVSWLEKPLTTYSVFKPTVIGELNYTVPPTPRRVRRETPVGSMLFHHLIMQASGPHVVNPNTANSGYNATNGLRFVYGESSPELSKNYPSSPTNIGETLSLSSGINQNQVIIKGIQVPKLPEESSISMPCFKGERFNDFVVLDNREASYGTKCKLDWMPFAFYLRGRQLRRSSGKVSIYVKNVINIDILKKIRKGENVNLNSWLSLGAQTFSRNLSSSPRDANFVPRGVRRWTGNFDKNNYPEYKMYSKLFARPGKKIRIKLVLERGVGSGTNVSWRARDLITFSPVMSYYQSKDRVECIGATSVESCSATYPATNTIIEDIGKTDFNEEAPNVEHRNLPCDSSSLSGSSAFSKVGFQNCTTCSVENNPNLKACLGSRDRLGAKKTIQCISNCSFDSSTKNCTNEISLDELNVGVKGNPNVNGSVAQREAKSICNIPSEDTKIFSFNELGGNFIKYNFLFPSEKFEYQREDCVMPENPDLPNRYARFKEASFESIESLFTKHEDKINDPNELVKTEKYSCFAPPKKFIFDSNTLESLPEDSMFKSEEFLTCNCKESAKNRIYKDSAYVEKFSNIELFAKIKCLETEPLLVQENPGNVCPAPIQQINQLDQWELVQGSPYIGSEVPDVCSSNDTSCKSEFVDYIGGEDTGSSGEYGNKALNIAYRATNTLAPWISSTCTKDNTCSNFQIETIGDSVNITGNVEVPLTILGNFKVPISVSGTRKEERHF